MIKELKKLFPDAKMVLKYSNNWELLVAVILSAQCTDKMVNRVTEKLFKKYKTLDDYLKADPDQFALDIKSTGFYRNKAKNILAAARLIQEKHHGKLPKTMPEMLKIPGVARKTANVVLGNAYGIVEGIAVDTHVKRLSHKYGLTKNSNPVKIEQDLMKIVPKKDWFQFTYLLIEYGRKYCPARKHNHENCPLTRSLAQKAGLFLGILLFPAISLAHVGYVTTEDQQAAYAGTDWNFILKTLLAPKNIALMLGTVIIFSILYFLAVKIPFFRRKIAEIQKNADSYENLRSWMIRLTLGIALIGSGTNGVLISPILDGQSALGPLQIALGFMLMAGFLIPVSLLLAIGLYLLAISHNLYMIGNLDFLALAISGLFLNNPRPGIDHLIGLPAGRDGLPGSIPAWSLLARFKAYAPLVLRLGIGISMIYLGIYEKFLNPNLSKLVITEFKLHEAIPVSPEMWVVSAAIIEVFIGFVLLIGLKTRLACVIAFLVLTGSFFYFKEGVYSHITLFGIISVIFVTGGGKLSLDEKILSRQQIKKPKKRLIA